MALTETQKAKIRFALGYDRGRDLHPSLESCFDTGNFSTEEETLIIALLSQIDALIAKQQDSILVNMDLKEGDGVTFLGPEQDAVLSRHGRRLVGQLNTFFQVPIYRDIFAAGDCTGGRIDLG